MRFRRAITSANISHEPRCAEAMSTPPFCERLAQRAPVVDDDRPSSSASLTGCW